MASHLNKNFIVEIAKSKIGYQDEDSIIKSSSSDDENKIKLDNPVI